MINYSGLPQRLRRIVKTYEYCVESVMYSNLYVNIQLKEEYKSSGYNTINTKDMGEVIDFLKSVTKPSSRVVKVALFGFKCPICGFQVHKDSNYTDLGGLKICTMCG